jgi:protoporphyrinogen oxidase
VRPEPDDAADETFVDYLIIGAGISGLAFANAIRSEAAAVGPAPPTLAIVEAADEPGGYCRTVLRDGFVWDYSGHFFHFAHPEIEAWLRARMPGRDVRTVVRKAKIRYAGRDLDFPFQAHIHQLPQDELIECLVDLHAASRAAASAGGDRAGPRSFKQMLYQKLGRGIAERFLIPYNEKLYACDLDELDPDAMGRFFPRADLDSVIANMRPPPPGSEVQHGYNATFTYPAGGAIEYVRALLHDLPPEQLFLGQRLIHVDRARRLATISSSSSSSSSRRQLRFGQLVSSAPLPELARLCEAEASAPSSIFSANKVLVYNLGFDRKGPRDLHWMYFPDPARTFYRVGWYDNILESDRMSLYVEVGAASGATLSIEATLARVLEELRVEGILTDHQLLAWHHVVLDPAYVHITGASLAATAALRAALAPSGIHSIGRYGGWTYCSIEDNIVEARALAKQLAGDGRSSPGSPSSP